MLHMKQKWHYNDRGKIRNDKKAAMLKTSIKKTGDAVLAPLGK